MLLASHSQVSHSLQQQHVNTSSAAPHKHSVVNATYPFERNNGNSSSTKYHNCTVQTIKRVLRCAVELWMQKNHMQPRVLHRDTVRFSRSPCVQQCLPVS